MGAQQIFWNKEELPSVNYGYSALYVEEAAMLSSQAWDDSSLVEWC